MSEQITATHTEGILCIEKQTLLDLAVFFEKNGLSGGESSIIWGDGIEDSHDPEYYHVWNLVCTGEGSRSGWEEIVKYVVPHLEGWADVVLLIEGGEYIEGYRIENGTIRDMDIRFEFNEIGGEE